MQSAEPSPPSAIANENMIHINRHLTLFVEKMSAPPSISARHMSELPFLAAMCRHVSASICNESICQIASKTNSYSSLAVNICTRIEEELQQRLVALHDGNVQRHLFVLTQNEILENTEVCEVDLVEGGVGGPVAKKSLSRQRVSIGARQMEWGVQILIHSVRMRTHVWSRTLLIAEEVAPLERRCSMTETAAVQHQKGNAMTA